MVNTNTAREIKEHDRPEEWPIMKSVRNEAAEAIEGWVPEQDIGAPNALKSVETYNGMPVMSEDDYIRFYNTDAKAMQNVLEGSTTTFNFQGYVRTDDGNLYYRDAMATNGLLKTDKHEGIHVGTDGIIDYNEMFGNHRMKEPEEVGEYDIYIKIPTEIQREKNVVCSCDSCETVESYKESFRVNDEQIRSEQSEQHYIVIRTGLDPKKDPYARQKIYLIHEAIVKHINDDGPLNEIADLVIEMETKFEELPAGKFKLHS